MEKEHVPILSQLVRTLNEIELKLEEAYYYGDADSFNILKKFMLKIQKQISQMLS